MSTDTSTRTTLRWFGIPRLLELPILRTLFTERSRGPTPIRFCALLNDHPEATLLLRGRDVGRGIGAVRRTFARFNGKRDADDGTAALQQAVRDGTLLVLGLEDRAGLSRELGDVGRDGCGAAVQAGFGHRWTDGSVLTVHAIAKSVINDYDSAASIGAGMGGDPEVLNAVSGHPDGQLSVRVDSEYLQVAMWMTEGGWVAAFPFEDVGFRIEARRWETDDVVLGRRALDEYC